MRGIWLAIPLFLIRYGLLSLLSRDALRRAAFFPPAQGAERPALWVYQFSTLLMLIWLFFLRVRTGSAWFWAGLCVYGAGVLLLAASVLHFAAPSAQGVNVRGLYRLSRNPMYVAYFVYFLGCVLLTRSVPLLFALLAFQISSHFLILSEERWCEETLGAAYRQYKQTVRRYFCGPARRRRPPCKPPCVYATIAKMHSETQ